MEIIGRDLAHEECAWNGDGQHWPAELGGVQLLVNGRAVPLKSVTSQRIVAHLPQDLPRSGVRVQLRRGETFSPIRHVYLGLTAPTLIHADTDPGLARVDRRGANVVFKATGLGPVVPPLPGGQLCPPEVPFRPVRDVTVRADGHLIPVEDCMLEPGAVGVFEIRIPQNAAREGQTVCVEAGGRRSNTLRL